jgi:hypothetical protein
MVNHLSKMNNLLRPHFLISLIVVLPCAVHAQGQTADPVAVVQAQLDAYNRQDIKSFAATFAENAELFQKIGDTVPAQKGRAAIEARYLQLFQQYPQNRSTLIGRLVQGNYVIDHEWITGRDRELKLIAVYEVIEGKIARAWFIR